MDLIRSCGNRTLSWPVLSLRFLTPLALPILLIGGCNTDNNSDVKHENAVDIDINSNRLDDNIGVNQSIDKIRLKYRKSIGSSKILNSVELHNLLVGRQMIPIVEDQSKGSLHGSEWFQSDGIWAIELYGSEITILKLQYYITNDLVCFRNRANKTESITVPECKFVLINDHGIYEFRLISSGKLYSKFYTPKIFKQGLF